MKIENLSVIGAINRQVMMLPKNANEELVLATQRFLESDHKAEVEKHAQRLEAVVMGYTDSPIRSSFKPYAFAQGVAVIPVHGVLINSFGSSYGYITGYNYIRSMIDMVEADDDVKGVIFDCASPGGMVQGLFETVEAIEGMSKPKVAFVESQATSACYAIAAATDQILVASDAVIGSIGVVRTHMDYSAYMEKLGIKVTMMYRGDHKVDGNPYEALSEDAKASWDSELDKWYDVFTESVAKNRNMDKTAVVNTQAAVYSGAESVTIGLSDSVIKLKDGFKQFLSGLNDPLERGSNAMSGEKDNTATAGDATTVDANAVAKSERERIAGIMGCDEAKGRNTLASHIAFNTTMGVDEAKSMLAASALESVIEAQPAAKDKANTAFAAAMDSFPNPEVGADSQENSATATEMSTAERILAAQRLVTGKGA